METFLVAHVSDHSGREIVLLLTGEHCVFMPVGRCTRSTSNAGLEYLIFQLEAEVESLSSVPLLGCITKNSAWLLCVEA